MNDDHFDDDIEYAETECPKCGSWEVYQRDCQYCEEGYSDHDCGDDCCCCLEPENNVVCDMCEGRGYHKWCRNCGWDLLEKRFLSKKYEDEFNAKQLEKSN